MYRSLLVPLDGSPFAEQALPLALNLAERAGASLQAVRVVPTVAHGFLRVSRSILLSSLEARTYLQETVAQLKRRSPVPVTGHLLQGDSIADTLRAHAESTGVDLVVLATHGRGPLGLFWVGSVACELLSCLPMPLLVLRPPAPPPPRTGSAESAPKHVLVPLDGSALAETILESAVSLGTLMNADYTLVRVISDLPLGSPEMDSVSLSAPTRGVLVQMRQIQKQQREQAREYLEKVAQPLRQRGLQVQTCVRIASTPADAILEMAPEYDFIALESKGRSGLSRLATPSVARKIVHGATAPLLVHSGATVRKSKD